jgi:myosin heavy subunit
MISAIQIRKAGFAFRISKEDFVKRYRPVLKGDVDKLLKVPTNGAANIREQFVQKYPKMKEWF